MIAKARGIFAVELITKMIPDIGTTLNFYFLHEVACHTPHERHRSKVTFMNAQTLTYLSGLMCQS